MGKEKEQGGACGWEIGKGTAKGEGEGKRGGK